MIVYQATKHQFLDDTFKRDIQEILRESYRKRTNRNVSPAEFAAWRESLFCMANCEITWAMRTDQEHSALDLLRAMRS